MAISSPIPVLNSGKPLVYQREMEHSRDLVAVEQLRIRTIARVRASLVRWNQTKGLIARVDAATEMIQEQTAKMERLYAAGQTDLLRLLQVATADRGRKRPARYGLAGDAGLQRFARRLGGNATTRLPATRCRQLSSQVIARRSNYG